MNKEITFNLEVNYRKFGHDEVYRVQLVDIPKSELADICHYLFNHVWNLTGISIISKKGD